MELAYEHDCKTGQITIITDSTVITTHESKIGFGPGFHNRVVNWAKSEGLAVEPEDFGDLVARLYYDYDREELHKSEVKRKKYGYFLCSSCGLVYHKSETQEPCGNCCKAAA